MDFPELTAFTEESAAVDETLAGVADDAWERPALGAWNLAQLTAHLVRAATRVTEYLPLPVEGDPVVDRIGYWDFDTDGQAQAIAQRAIDEAAAVDPTHLPGRFAVSWRATCAAANDHGPDQVLHTIMGPMRLDEYLATRVVEITIHHLDVRVALDLPPAPTPSAGRMTMGILEQLLGEPRPRNMGRTRFLQAATGRIPTDDPRFPVLH